MFSQNFNKETGLRAAAVSGIRFDDWEEMLQQIPKEQVVFYKNSAILPGSQFGKIELFYQFESESGNLVLYSAAIKRPKSYDGDWSAETIEEIKEHFKHIKFVSGDIKIL
jgi:hypothetical protein